MRTDIHRPSAIQPDDYFFVACEVADSDGLFMDNAFARQRLREHMDRTGGRFSTHEHGGSCHICGAHCIYMAWFHHAPTNTYIATGLDCAQKFEMGDAVVFRSFREKARAGMQAAAGKAKARALLEERGLTPVWDLVTGNNPHLPMAMGDLVAKLIRYGDLSEAQWRFLDSLLTQEETREARQQAWRARNALSVHVGTVGQRMGLRLTVDWVKSFDSAYGTVYIHGLRDEAGNVVIYKGSRRLAERGNTLNMKATISAHELRDGTAQTIVSRPANITINTEVAA